MAVKAGLQKNSLVKVVWLTFACLLIYRSNTDSYKAVELVLKKTILIQEWTLHSANKACAALVEECGTQNVVVSRESLCMEFVSHRDWY